MLSDDDLRSQLSALAECMPPSQVDPNALLRAHARRRRQHQLLGAAVLATVATLGVSLGSASQHGGNASQQRLTTPGISTCPVFPSPTPRAVATHASTATVVVGPGPTQKAVNLGAVDQRIPAQVADALDLTAGSGVVRTCDLVTDLLYQLDGRVTVDVAAVRSADTSAAENWITVRRYPDGTWLGTKSTDKTTKVELRTARYLIVWTAEGGEHIATLLEAWAGRLHDALGG